MGKTIQEPVYAGPWLNDASEAAIRRAVAAGSHYFDAGTMRYFGSKAYEGFDMADGSTVVVMSNRDRPNSFGPGVLGGRRHFYLIVVTADGGTLNEGPDRYDVSKGTGYWFSKASAVRAAKKLAAGGAS